MADRLTLHLDWPLNTSVIAAALRDVIADQCGQRQFTAVDDLLSRAAPRLMTGPKPDLLDGSSDPVAGTIAIVASMDGTVLPIQGPPGTGKTYVTARAILSLVREGHRVGVASNSHEAVRNVLMGCLAALDDDSDITLKDVELAHKVSGDEDGYPDGFTGVTRVTSNDDPALTHAHVVGGTSCWSVTRASCPR